MFGKCIISGELFSIYVCTYTKWMWSELCILQSCASIERNVINQGSEGMGVAQSIGKQNHRRILAFSARFRVILDLILLRVQSFNGMTFSAAKVVGPHQAITVSSLWCLIIQRRIEDSNISCIHRRIILLLCWFPSLPFSCHHVP